MRRNAALFVLISIFSGLGGTAVTLAAGIWIFDLTGDPGLAALAGLGVYLPSLAAPWLGALVDRFPRRVLLITVEIVVAAVLLALLPVGSAGQVWLIYLVMLVRGLGYVLLDAGESALLPVALPAARLGDVNGWRSSAQEGTKLLAPLGGAALYTWAGPYPVVLISAALPLISAVLYAMLRLEPAPATTRAAGSATEGAVGVAATYVTEDAAGVAATYVTEDAAGVGATPVAGVERASLRWSSVREGLTALAVEPLRTPVSLATVAIAVSGLTNAAVLARIVDGFHLPAAYLGVLSTAQGAGSVVAGLLVGRLLARVPAARVAGIGVLVFAAAGVAWSLPWGPVMLLGSALAGAGLVWALIAGVTAIQSGTPAHLLGRVAATGNTAMFGPLALTIPLGAALVGLGARTALLTGVALLLTAFIVASRQAGTAGRLPGPERGRRGAEEPTERGAGAGKSGGRRVGGGE